MSLRKAVFVYATLFTLISAANLLLLRYSQDRSATNESWVLHTHEVLHEASELMRFVKSAETGQRGFLLTQDPSYLVAYNYGVTQAHLSEAELRELTYDNIDQQTRLDTFNTLINIKFAELKRTIALTKNGERQAALEIVRSDLGLNTMNKILALMDEFVTEEEALLSQRSQLHRSDQNVYGSAFILSFLAFVALVASFMWVIQTWVISP